MFKIDELRSQWLVVASHGVIHDEIDALKLVIFQSHLNSLSHIASCAIHDNWYYDPYTQRTYYKVYCQLEESIFLFFPSLHSSDIRNTSIFRRCSKRSIFKYFFKNIIKIQRLENWPLYQVFSSIFKKAQKNVKYAYVWIELRVCHYYASLI